MSSIGSSRANSTNNTLENAGAKFLMTDEHKKLVKKLIKLANDKNFPKKNLSLMAKQRNIRRTSISPSLQQIRKAMSLFSSVIFCAL